MVGRLNVEEMQDRTKSTGQIKKKNKNKRERLQSMKIEEEERGRKKSETNPVKQ